MRSVMLLWLSMLAPPLCNFPRLMRIPRRACFISAPALSDRARFFTAEKPFRTVQDPFISIPGAFISIKERFISIETRLISINERLISIEEQFISIEERHQS